MQFEEAVVYEEASRAFMGVCVGVCLWIRNSSVGSAYHSKPFLLDLHDTRTSHRRGLKQTTSGVACWSTGIPGRAYDSIKGDLVLHRRLDVASGT